MADTQSEQVPASQFTQRLVDALVKAVEGATSPEMLAAQAVMIRRLALSGDVAPSRLPAPRNITEVGGYLNLLHLEGQEEMRRQALASALGVAGPVPGEGSPPGGPTLFFVLRANDRPPGAAQTSIPTHFPLRSDFAPGLDAALATLRAAGFTLPLLTTRQPLPRLAEAVAPSLLGYLGRELELMPTAALRDPDTDPLALARLTAGGPLQVVSRQLDPGAPQAAAVAARDWTAWTCPTGAACFESAAQRKYLELGPLLNAAAWYQAPPGAPASLSRPGTWATWSNTTGLVPGRTTLGDELRALHPDAAIAASSVRELVHRVWDGTGFV